MSSNLVRAIWLSLVFGLPAFSDAIVSQLPNGVHIYQISSAEHADDVVLTSPTTIAAIQFWAVATMGGPVEPPGGFPAAFNGTISWAIEGDASGLPGGILFSGSTSSILPVATGTILFGTLHEYTVAFNLTAPVSLAPGRYWLELHEGPTLTSNDGSEIDWETAFSNPTLPFAEKLLSGGGWFSGSEQLAFQVFNTPITPVPEPSTGAMASVGLIVLGAITRAGRVCRRKLKVPNNKHDR